jgi:amino acid adenylation domain-containing protein
VRWQAEMLAGAEGERQWQYWRSKLSGELPVLNMATDHPRPAVQTFAGHWVPFRLSRELSGQLKNLAQARGLTLYTLLLTAYQILLHRYTGQEDILVGCPTTGRPQQIFDAMVGHFVNTVVVRADFANDPILEQFMEQMRQTVIEALDHQDYPFSLLVDRLNPQRDSSRPPLFQTMFVFQKPQTEFGALDVVTDFYFGEARLNIGGFEMESFPIAQQEGQFDLSIEMTGAADNLKGVLKYNQELFEAATVADMSRHFINLLQSMVAHPEQHLSELDLMDEAEQRTLLEELNDTGTDWDIQGVHRLFEEQAVRTPEAIALVFEREQMSYRELDERAGRLGGYLIQQGLQPGNPVGICVKRSLAMIVGIIAILKAGGAYVPLDPSYPKERLDFMVADARISLLLVNEHLAKRVASSNVKMIKVDQEWPLIGANRALKAERELGAASLAYILYTSGSTGKPKGVAMPHRALCNLIRWQIGNVMGPVNAKTLQYTTLNFDVSFQEIFATLAGGGTLVLFREELRYDPAALLQLMRNEAVERLFIPFVFLQMIADTVAANDNLLPSSLREIITAGEQLQITAPIRHLFEKLPQCRLCNQYGPTEAHVVTSFSLDVNPENWSFLPPIGKPIANASIYILDSHFQPVPRGVAGELYIGGLCLADGYYCRPELTETKFISKPGRNLPGRLYRTGDWARMLPDGNIQFLGRTDHQIKIRGVRIEPAEIEEQLLSYDLVSAAVVVGREEPTGGKALCAYYVSERDFAIAELKDFLAQKLPSQMIPAYFVKLAKIPLLPNQKVDRLALPQPEHTGRSEAAFMAPRDEVEAQLVKICCEVLNLDKIGVNDNLFDLGVNSLITLNIQRKIERFYSGAIRIPDLMNYPTIAGLAALIKTRESDATVIDGRAEQFRNFLDGISKED